MPEAGKSSTSTTNVVPIRPVPAPATEPRRRAGRRTFGSISRLPSGNWRARYADPSHQGPGRPAWVNAPTTFLTKRDAAGWLAAREAEIVEHRWRPAPPAPGEPVVSFAGYSAGWLASRELKPSTMREYTRMLKVLVGAFGKQRLDEITSADVRQWYAGLNPELKTARAHHYALLRNVLGSAVDEELITVNPCRIRAAGVTKRERRIQPASLEELAHLVAEMPERYRALVVTATWCALRFGELTELRRHDVQLADDDSSGWLHVRRAVTWPTPHTPVVTTPKSNAGYAMWRSHRISSRCFVRIWPFTRCLAPTDWCSPTPRASTCTTAASTKSSSAHGRRSTGRISASMTSDTLGRPWPPKPAPPCAS